MTSIQCIWFVSTCNGIFSVSAIIFFRTKDKGNRTARGFVNPADIVLHWNITLVWNPIDSVSTKNEPRHDKTNKLSVRPVKTQISLGIRPVWSVIAVHMKKAWVLSCPLNTQRRLIRLGGCPGWSESSLGAQSLCWFCHVAAQIFIEDKSFTVTDSIVLLVMADNTKTKIASKVTL